MSQGKTILFLCKTESCGKWFSCGGKYGTAGETLVEQGPKSKTFLCKNFELASKECKNCQLLKESFFMQTETLKKELIARDEEIKSLKGIK